MDSYYLLLDKQSALVSKKWKVTHLFCLLNISISGLCAGFFMGRTSLSFGGRCFLFSEINFVTNKSFNEVILSMYPALERLPLLPPIDLHSSVWGPRSLCYFCQFTPLTSTIFGITWFSFFMMCSRGGAGFLADTFVRPWRIVFPALLFGIIGAILMIINFIYLLNGSRHFCKEFVSVFNTTECSNYIDGYTEFFMTDKRDFYLSLMIGVSATLICCVFWILHVITLTVRITCIVDFEMVSVVIKSKTKPEKILPIITGAQSRERIDVIVPSSGDEKPENGKSTTYVPSKSIQFWSDDNSTLPQDDVDLIELQSTNKKSSPSINFVDDSPFSENNKSIGLIPIKLSPDNQPEETSSRAPRVDFSSL